MPAYTTCKGPGCARRIRRRAGRANKTGLCRPCYEQGTRVLGKERFTGEEVWRALVHYAPTHEQAEQAAKADDVAEGVSRAAKWAQSTREYPDAELLTGDWMVCSDIHAPHHCSLMLSRMTQVAYTHGVTRLAVIGDLMDMEALSGHRKLAAKRMSAIESILTGLHVLGALCLHFKEIVVTKGNHEARLEKIIEAAVEQATPASRALMNILESEDLQARQYGDRYVDALEQVRERYASSLKDRIRFLRFHDIQIAGPDGAKPWRWMHQKSYSRRPPYAGLRQWQRWTQPIGTTHTHHAGLAIAPNGRDPMVNLGCMTRAEAHAYKREADTGYPAWTKGFGMVRHGVLSVYTDNPYLTDWSVISADYQRARHACRAG